MNLELVEGISYEYLIILYLLFIRSNDIERGESKGNRVSDDLENKYGKLYEDTVVNPFAIFNRKERYVLSFVIRCFSALHVLIGGQV
jgi:hypothetical protein